MKYLISGGKKLCGEVSISGAKNAVLPIMAASLLSKESCHISNIPKLRDVVVMSDILKHLGVDYNQEGDNKAIINSNNVNSVTISEQLMRMLRASNLVMGPLLSRFGEANIAFPGGCNIGSRPMDLHLKAFEKMGVQIVECHGFIHAKAAKLKGAEIHLDFPSVGATENIMMAATLADGTTVIRNAAREPEVSDLQNFLTAMGAKIRGAGTDTITIYGVNRLHSVEYKVIPDRIEAGTYLVAAAITQGDIEVREVIPEHLDPVISKLQEMGVSVQVGDSAIRIKHNGHIKPVDVKTLPYPGFPTDMQAQMMALLSTISGTSIIIETIFENRFKHVAELRRMGANIKIDGRVAVINGVDKLSGAAVEASDLRAGAALVLAGLCAQGETVVENGQYIQRGYDDIDKKLRKIGADITKIDE